MSAATLVESDVKARGERDLFDVIAHETATLRCILSVLEIHNDEGEDATSNRLEIAEGALRYAIERLEHFTGEVEVMQTTLREMRGNVVVDNDA
jgi:hypothetical protein